MVQDAGRWQPGVQGRPAFVRGQLRVDPASGARELLPAVAQGALGASVPASRTGINEAAARLPDLHPDRRQRRRGRGGRSAEVARELRPMMRRHDLFAALGPNRFALALTCCPASDAAGAMKRLAALLQVAGRVLPASRRRLRAGPHLQGHEAAALRRAGLGLGRGPGRGPQLLRSALRQAVAGGRAGAVRLDRRPQRPQPDAGLPADGGGADARADPDAGLRLARGARRRARSRSVPCRA